jgi:rhamnogalacturonyl hydrolase YesR
MLVFLGLFAQASARAGEEEAGAVPAGMLPSAIGVTRQGTPIASWLNREDLELGSQKFRILLVGGLDGEASSSSVVRESARWFQTHDDAKSWRSKFLVSAVPAVLPDGLGKGAAGGSEAGRGFPPPPAAYYQSPTAPEAAYLWRWIGMHAPDLVVDVRAGDRMAWLLPPAEHAGWKKLISRLMPAGTAAEDDELVVQLNRVAACETGIVPALRVNAADRSFLATLLAAVDSAQVSYPSPARRELQARLDRTPLQVARQLSEHYGHALEQVVYIPAVALIGRLRLGELLQDATHRTDVERIVGPYVQGTRNTKPDNGSALSGHLIFCELADRSEGAQRARYIELAKAAANQAFDATGRPLESMPYHTEMSDALFMGGPILAHVGSLTGEERYFEACLRHLKFMRQLCLRPDGLYRHSPLDESAWGRGNGFPALGVTLSLAEFPPDHPGRRELREWLISHLQALLPHQDPTGCWHQVIDRPESYRELTATCMIAYAMARGMREGWLEKSVYQPAVDRAWYAIRTRVPASGRLVDVCTGTGKQKSLRDYYDRPAILGRDDRGGAMSLLIAAELAQGPAGARLE